MWDIIKIVFILVFVIILAFTIGEVMSYIFIAITTFIYPLPVWIKLMIAVSAGCGIGVVLSTIIEFEDIEDEEE